MKLTVVILSLAAFSTTLITDASAAYVFTIPYAQGASLSNKQFILVRLPTGAPTYEFQYAFNAGFTDIQIKAVANANSDAYSKGSKEDLGFGGELLDIPVVIKAFGIPSITSVIPVGVGEQLNEIYLESLDVGTSVVEISSAGDVIYDPYVKVTCDPANSGPMDITITLSQPVAEPGTVPEPGTLTVWSVLGVCLGGYVWQRRARV